MAANSRYPWLEREDLVNEMVDDPWAPSRPTSPYDQNAPPSSLNPQIGQTSTPTPTPDTGSPSLAPSATYTPSNYSPTDFGGGDAAQQARQIGDARNTPAPPGFDATKWADPTHNSVKYRAGTILAGGGQIGDVLRDPLFAGWKQIDDDKIQAPDGAVFDLFFDVGGPQQRVQWTQTEWAPGTNTPAPGAAPGTPAPGAPGTPGTPTTPTAPNPYKSFVPPPAAWDEQAYLFANPDVAAWAQAMGLTGWDHYAKYGRNENRPGVTLVAAASPGSDAATQYILQHLAPTPQAPYNPMAPPASLNPQIAAQVQAPYNPASPPASLNPSLAALAPGQTPATPASTAPSPYTSITGAPIPTPNAPYNPAAPPTSLNPSIAAQIPQTTPPPPASTPTGTIDQPPPPVTPAEPPPGPPPVVPGTTTPPGLDQATRDMLLQFMQSNAGTPSINDPNLKAQADAYSRQRFRGAGRERQAAAERAAFMGLNPGGQSSGAFETQVGGINEGASEDTANFNATLVGNEVQARRASLLQALQIAESVGARAEGNQIRQALAALDAQMYREGLQQNQGQYAGRLGFDYAQLLATLNRDAYLGGLG